MASVEARSVSVAIGSETLLPSTSLRVESGGALAVRGPNGAGKTTLLRVVAGLVRPSGGSALVDDRPVDARDRHFRGTLAALIDEPAFARELTLAEHLAFVAATWGASNDAAREAASGLLGDLGIDELAHRFPHELSSGQRQLFSIALTLARPSDVLLLDEPEQRLDENRLAVVLELLNRRRAAGVTLLVATHSELVAERIADEVQWLGVQHSGAGHSETRREAHT